MGALSVAGVCAACAAVGIDEGASMARARVALDAVTNALPGKDVRGVLLSGSAREGWLCQLVVEASTAEVVEASIAVARAICSTFENPLADGLLFDVTSTRGAPL